MATTYPIMGLEKSTHWNLKPTPWGRPCSLFNKNHQGKENCKRRQKNASALSDHSYSSVFPSQPNSVLPSTPIRPLTYVPSLWVLSAAVSTHGEPTCEARQLKQVPCYRKEVCTRWISLSSRKNPRLSFYLCHFSSLTGFVTGRGMGWVRTGTLGILLEQSKHSCGNLFYLSKKEKKRKDKGKKEKEKREKAGSLSIQWSVQRGQSGLHRVATEGEHRQQGNSY